MAKQQKYVCPDCLKSKNIAIMQIVYAKFSQDEGNIFLKTLDAEWPEKKADDKTNAVCDCGFAGKLADFINPAYEEANQ